MRIEPKTAEELAFDKADSAEAEALKNGELSPDPNGDLKDQA